MADSVLRITANIEGYYLGRDNQTYIKLSEIMGDNYYLDPYILTPYFIYGEEFKRLGHLPSGSKIELMVIVSGNKPNLTLSHPNDVKLYYKRISA